MRLDELLSPFFKVIAAADKQITHVTECSSNADADAIFVCVRGAVSDGHRYAHDAYARGCRVFLAEYDPVLPSDALVFLTDNTRRLIGPLASRLLNSPSSHLSVVGVTGTKGKTTVAGMLSHILNRNGIATGYVGTNGIRFNDVKEETRNTTPDPVSLQQTFARMLSSGIEVAVIEISSQALKQFRVDGTKIDVAIFTNLFPDHIGGNEHPDFNDYKACKHRLFTDLAPKTVIVNADDAENEYMIQNTPAQRVIFCSTQAKTSSDYIAPKEDILPKKDLLGVDFTLQNPCREESYLPLLGKVNVSNALLAVACAVECFRIPLSSALEALKDVKIKGRSEVIPLPFGAHAVIDYAHNGESLATLLQTLRAYTNGRLLCLFGSVGERTQGRRQELGNAAARYSDVAYITSDNPQNEPPEQITAEIAEAFQGYETPYYRISDRESAIALAVSQMKPGDILVLAGKGHETYQLIGSQKIPFCEREIVLREASKLPTTL